MLNISGSNILIVGETPQACDMRARLVEGGACVHVVSIAGAMLLIRCKQIDGAFVAAALDDCTRKLCAELETQGALVIFVAPGGDQRNLHRVPAREVSREHRHYVAAGC